MERSVPRRVLALLAWQQAHKLPVTGVLDKATWVKLATGAV